ncbi:hypothetical protein AAG570_002283 [Ranatra chinensis]|uniref:Uncharacterized protein n=1 Tax=Ranatra chinensis TaxID=642074 RepID=A0ABD0Y728_9HEMI
MASERRNMFYQNKKKETTEIWCVGPDWKSLGMGVQWVLVRSLGTIPGPVIIGWIIDTGCVHWRRNPCSDTRGECIVYDTYAIGRYIAAMGIFFKGMQVIFLGLAKWSNAKRLSEA